MISMKRSEPPLTFVFPLEFFYVRRNERGCLDELKLDSQVCIREITALEKKILQEHVSHKLFPGHRELCLEVKAENVIPALEVVHPIISTLRLLEPWKVGINFCLLHDFPTNGGIEIFPPNAPMEIFWSPWGPKRESCRLSGENVEVFNRLYRGCKEAIPNDNKFKFAIARFNQSYSTKYFEDKLLDWIITLEAIFLTGESEKAFRLRAYMSIFLGETPTEKEKIWTFMKKAYGLRGQIVHSGVFLPRSIKIGNTKIPRQKFMDKIEDFVRTSLRKYVEWKMANRTLDFHKVLDKSIYDIRERKKNLASKYLK